MKPKALLRFDSETGNTPVNFKFTMSRFALPILAATLISGCGIKFNMTPEELERAIAAQTGATVITTVDVDVTPLTHDFGSVLVGTNSATQVFTFTNNGADPATGCSLPQLLGPDAGEFTITANTCGTADLLAAASCTVTVRSNPVSAGAKAAYLSRACSVGGTAATTTNGITATGVVPALAWSPLTNAYGNILVGSNSGTVNFTLTNSGGAAATACSAPVITDTTNFTVTSDACGTSDLAPLANCIVQVRANPTTSGLKQATLSRTCTVGGTPATTTNGITVTGAVATLAWSPLTNGFGSQLIGTNSSSVTFTLSNSGGVAATGCSVPVIGDTTNFTITADTCGTANVNAASSCTVDVRANPTTTGLKQTTLSRTCTVGGTPTTTTNGITVTGTNATLAWSPLTHGFGTQQTGTNSSSVTFTLSNSGGANATGCSAPTITDTTNFTITADTCGTANVNAASSCTVDVRANPTTTGLKQATLSRTCTVGGTPTTTTNGITVTGAVATLAWSPLTNDFGSVLTGTNTSSVTFTLSNSGGLAATGCSAPVIGDTTNFTITADTCGTANVNAASSCTVNIRANPTTIGLKQTTLSRTCTVGGTPTTTTNGIQVTGVAAGLAWSPLTNNFGGVLTGTNTSSVTFTLSNTGGAAATGCSAPTITDTTNFTITADTCGTANLNAASSCTIDVRANPTTTGLKQATISRFCTVGGTTSTTTNGIQVTGSSPSLAWSPLTNDFGSQLTGTNSSNVTFTLTNSGGANATGCSAPVIGDTTNFTITADTCGTANVNAASSCTIDVRANPTTTGLKQTTISRTCTVGGTPATTTNGIQVTGISPGLAWSPLTHGFGTQQTGTNSSSVTFTLNNSGGANATGCSAPVIGDTTNFTITADTCSTANLNAASSCTVDIRANPTTTGLKQTTLSRTCTVGGTVSTTTNGITVTGAVATLAWSPLTNNYGSVSTGSNSSNVTFTLSNSGGLAATGCSAPVIGDTTNFTITADTCGTANVNAASSCTIDVRANPTTTGLKQTTISRTCTVGGTPTTTTNGIQVTGVTVTLAWSPLTNGFGSQLIGTNSSSVTFTLSNSGGAAATGCSAPVIGDTTNFTITADTCGTANVNAASSCTVDVRANPTTTGLKQTTLSRTCTVGGTPTTTTNGITVTGTSPTLAWSPLTNGFGSQLIGTNSSSVTFTLSNSGGANATGCSAPVIGDTTNFTITADTCGTANVNAASSCTVDIRANPTTTGLKQTTLSRTCTVGGTPTTTTNGITVTGTNATLAWSPLTNGFGSQLINTNSSSVTFTLSNSGGANATGCSAPVIGDTTNFTITADTCGTANVNAASSCTVDIRANPTTTGLKQTTLSRTCTVGGTPTTTTNGITVTGTSPTLAWSPLTNNYGSIAVGSNSSTTTFTLSNSGTANATGCSAPVIGDTTNFTITADTCGTANLNTASSCTIDVRANPTTSGLKQTTISRTCTVGGTPATTTNGIQVTGVAPVLAWSPLTHGFGSVETGSQSAVQTFTLSNSGTANATGCSAPVLGGANPTQFTIVTDNCGTANVNTASSCTVDVRANPTSLGAKTATLSRTCTVGGTVSTTTNGITATGVDTTAPVITNAYITLTDGVTLKPNATYGIGATMAVVIVFNETITVSGTPVFSTNMSGVTLNCAAHGTLNTALQCNYTVAAGQYAYPLETLSASALTAGTYIRDASSNNANRTLALNALSDTQTINILGSSPEPTNLIVTPTHASPVGEITLTWTSGGGSTTGFKVAYVLGTTPPATCSAGTVVDVGNVTTKVFNTLNPFTNYAFRVCSYNVGLTSEGITKRGRTSYAYEDVAADGNTGDDYGTSVDIHGNLSIIGYPGEDSNATDGGAVAIQQLDVTTGIWQQMYVLAPGDIAAGDRFGTSVSIWGNMAAIGAPGVNSGAGAVYIYVGVSGAATWTQVAKLTASDAAAADGFGSSVDLSGRLLVAGAAGNDDAGANSGSAYIFGHNGTAWTQMSKLTASDAAAGAVFGTSVSIQGMKVAVGSPGDSLNQGSVYIYDYEETTTSWFENTKLTASDGAAGDEFGTSVSVWGSSIMVGAPKADNSGTDRGSAYLYQFITSTDTYNQRHKYVAASPTDGDLFGSSVSIMSRQVIVGAPGYDSERGMAQVFYYKDTTNTWTTGQFFMSSDNYAGDHYGKAVSIFGTQIIVGAPQGQTYGGVGGSASLYNLYPEMNSETLLTATTPTSGGRFAKVGVHGTLAALSGIEGGVGKTKVYEYNPTSHGWDLTHTITHTGTTTVLSKGTIWGDVLVAANAYGTPERVQIYRYNSVTDAWEMEANITEPVTATQFGWDPDVFGETVVMGALNTGVNVKAWVYQYQDSTNTWVLTSTLVPSDAAANDSFGIGVGLDGTTIVIGDNTDRQPSATTGKGAAYIFQFTGTSWIQTHKLQASDAGAADLFGSHVDISGENVVVSAIDDDNNSAPNPDEGSVYVFTYDGTTWVEAHELRSGDAAVENSDHFGNGLAIEASTLCIANNTDNDVASQAGSAYIFELNAALAWTKIAKFAPSAQAASDWFGYYHMEISGNVVAIGADQKTVSGQGFAGVGYYFKLPIVDGPAISSVIGSTPNGTYREGDTITFEITYDENLVFGGTGPILANMNTGEAATCIYTAPNKLTCTYNITLGHGNPDLSVVSLSLNGATLTNGAGVPASLIVGTTVNLAANNDYAIWAYTYPPNITALHVIPRNKTSATLKWLSGGYTTTGYRIAYVLGVTPPADCTTGTQIDAGNVLTYDVGSLTAYTNYAFRVCAYDAETDYASGITGRTITDQYKLPDVGEYFGRDVAISGNKAAVVKNNEVRIYKYNVGTDLWTLEQALAISVNRVSMDGNRLIAGSHIYEFNGTTWNLMQTLTASDGGLHFGNAGVAIEGNVAVVGAYGKSSIAGGIYIFRYNGSTWVEEYISPVGRDPADALGFNVDISGNFVIAGRSDGSNTGDYARIYHYNGSAWSMQQQITGSDTMGSDDYGYDVAISGNFAVVGAVNKDYPGHPNEGAAYIYYFNGTTWNETQMLTQVDPNGEGKFGGSLAIDGNRLVVGPYNSINNDTQLIYAYTYSGGVWSQSRTPFYGSDNISDTIGGLDISGTKIITPSMFWDDPLGAATGKGTAYIFDMP